MSPELFAVIAFILIVIACVLVIRANIAAIRKSIPGRNSNCTFSFIYTMSAAILPAPEKRSDFWARRAGLTERKSALVTRRQLICAGEISAASLAIFALFAWLGHRE